MSGDPDTPPASAGASGDAAEFGADWDLDDAAFTSTGDILGESPLADELKSAEEQRREQEQSEEQRLQKAREEAAEAGRQSRRDVRVDARFEMRYRLDGGGVPVKGRTRDLSATGFGFSTRNEVDKDMTGMVTLELEGWRFQKPFAIRFLKPIVAGYRVGAQFIELNDDERDRLARVVFDVQRQQLRKGA